MVNGYLPKPVQQRTEIEFDRLLNFMVCKGTSLDVTGAKAKATEKDQLKEDIKKLKDETIIEDSKVVTYRVLQEVDETVGNTWFGPDEKAGFFYLGKREYRNRCKKHLVATISVHIIKRANGTGSTSEKETAQNWKVIDTWTEYCYHAAVGPGHGWRR